MVIFSIASANQGSLSRNEKPSVCSPNYSYAKLTNDLAALHMLIQLLVN